MPNWCTNELIIYHSEVIIENIAQYLYKNKGKSFFNIWYPDRKDFSGDNNAELEFNMKTFGCKWNCDADEWIVSADKKSIEITFRSPWCPPLELYRNLAKFCYEVKAYYEEPLAGIKGRFEHAIVFEDS